MKVAELEWVKMRLEDKENRLALVAWCVAAESVGFGYVLERVVITTHPTCLWHETAVELEDPLRLLHQSLLYRCLGRMGCWCRLCLSLRYLPREVEGLNMVSSSYKMLFAVNDIDLS